MRAANPQLGGRRRRRVVATAAEPWRVMVFVWQAVTAALIPISLRDVPTLLARFLEHLARDGARCRERRAAAFLRHLQASRA
jgi:heme exporter protein D